MDWLYSSSGFVVGLLVGMSGVGGGALMTPLLVLGFSISPAVAVGTDLWFAAITKSVGSFMHHQNGGVDWQVLRRLCIGSIPASIATLIWLRFFELEQSNGEIILIVLGYTLLVTAVAILLKNKINVLGTKLRIQTPAQFHRLQPALTVLAGGSLGVLVTLTSVGAGALGVVVLAYLYPLRMKASKLVGTDIAHAIPLTIVAGSGYLWMGDVDGVLLWKLLIGSVPGVMIGASLSSKIPEVLLRTVIAIVLAGVGFRLLL